MPPVVYMNYEVLYTGFTHKKLRTILKGLKVKTNEKEGGSGMWQMIDIGLRKRWWMFFPFLIVLQYEKKKFPFLVTPAALIGDVLTNR